MADIKWPAVALAAFLLFACGAGLGLWVEGLRWRADVATVQKNNDEALKRISDAAQAQTARALSQQQAAQADVAAIDAKYNQDLSHAQSEISRLRASIAAGAISLHVAAVCRPAGGDALPGQSIAAGGVDAAGPRLTDAAQRNYFILKERIAVSANQINGLQAYIKNVCLNNIATVGAVPVIETANQDLTLPAGTSVIKP